MIIRAIIDIWPRIVGIEAVMVHDVRGIAQADECCDKLPEKQKGEEDSTAIECLSERGEF